MADDTAQIQGKGMENGVTKIDVQFVTHLQAGMVEQEVYIDNGDDVVRATLEQLADPAVQGQMVYVSSTFNDHDPFQILDTPIGPFPKGQPLGFTMEEWLAATSSKTYSINGGTAHVNLSFGNLIPNGTYHSDGNTHGNYHGDFGPCDPCAEFRDSATDE